MRRCAGDRLRATKGGQPSLALLEGHGARADTVASGGREPVPPRASARGAGSDGRKGCPLDSGVAFMVVGLLGIVVAFAAVIYVQRRLQPGLRATAAGVIGAEQSERAER